MELIEDLIDRLGEDAAEAVLVSLWDRPILKRDALGIHGTLFYDNEDRRAHIPPSKREVDWDSGSVNQTQRALFAKHREFVHAAWRTWSNAKQLYNSLLVSPGKRSAGEFSAAKHRQMTRAAKTAINDQFDLFLPYPADLPLRDQREMKRPFLSLAKSKRVRPIDYLSPDDKAWAHVSANLDYDMATIWDADILIYCASTLADMARRALNDISRKLHQMPYDLLRAIHCPRL